MTQAKYSPVARLFHWIMALMVIGIIPMGLYMHELEKGDFKAMLYNNHRSLGFLILVLAILRLAYRLVNGAPADHPGLEPWQKLSAKLMHMALYVLVFAVPLVGWLGSSAYGFPGSFFGLFPLPQLVSTNKALGEQFMELHELGAYALAALVILHIVAGLYHLLVRRDGVFQRMT